MQAIREVRINQNYSSLLTSETHEREKKESLETVSKIRHSIMSTSDLMKRLTFSPGATDTGIIPMNCRFHTTAANGDDLFVIEDPPSIRTIKVEYNMHAIVERLTKSGKLKEYGYSDWLVKNKKPYKFTLSFPYVIYIIRINRKYPVNVKLFFRIHPLTCLEDYLIIAPILNLNSNQQMCMGEIPGAETVNEAVANGIDSFWFNQFNTDYYQNITLYQDRQYISDFITWEYNTKKDPMFIFDVQWKRHNRVLSAEIADFTGGGRLDDPSNAFETVTRAFRKDGDKVVGGKSITDSFILNDSTALTAGDEVQYKNKVYYIKCFYGDRYALPNYVTLESEDASKTLDIRLTNGIQKTLSNSHKKGDIEQLTLSNGMEIKSGDILCVDFPFKSYKKVTALRKARDGAVEVRLGSDFYLASNLKASKFDAQEIKVGNLALKEGSVYVIMQDEHRSRRQSFPFVSAYSVIFQGIDVGDSGEVAASFAVNNDSHPISRTLNNDFPIFEEDPSKSVRTMKAGGSLITVSEDQTFYMQEGVRAFISSSGSQNSYMYDHRLSCTEEYALGDILNDDNTEVTMKGFDHTINFKIGDQVVIADWGNPAEMIKIRTIVRFEYNTEMTSRLNAITVDSDSVEKSTNIVDLYGGKINIGAIRKISTEYLNISAGTKIKATEAGVCNFPKKDVNEIIGFLTDTGCTPLMLCSNLCTIWAHPSEFNKFEFINRRSPRWTTLTNAPPNLDKIKVLDGDMFEINSELYMMVRLSYSNRLRAMSVTSVFSPSITNRSFSPMGPRHGFITPRYTGPQLRILPSRAVYPNYHGGYMQCHSHAFIKADWIFCDTTIDED